MIIKRCPRSLLYIQKKGTDVTRVCASDGRYKFTLDYVPGRDFKTILSVTAPQATLNHEYSSRVAENGLVECRQQRPCDQNSHLRLVKSHRAITLAAASLQDTVSSETVAFLKRRPSLASMRPPCLVVGSRLGFDLLLSILFDCFSLCFPFGHERIKKV